MPALTIVVPTYNEVDNVESLLARVTTALAAVDFELIIVDDSTDATAQLLADLAGRTPCLRIIHRPGRRGLASAVTDGIALATGEIVSVLDADLQHPPEVLPALCAAIVDTDADLAIASRYIPGGGHEFSLPRRMVSRVATALAQVLLPRARSVADPLSGFFAFRRRVVDDVHLRPVGYKILLEILVRGRLARVVEVPYRFRARRAGESKLGAAENLQYLAHLLRLSTVRTTRIRRLLHASGCTSHSGG